MKTSIKHFPILLLFLFVSNCGNLNGQNLNLSTFKGAYQTDLLPDKNEEYLLYYLGISGNSAILQRIIYKKKDYDKNLMIKYPKTLALLEKSLTRSSSEILFNGLIQPFNKLEGYTIIDPKTNDKLMNIRIFDNYLTVNNSLLHKLEENIKLYQSVSYYDNGEIRTEGRYQNGKRNGNWSFFDENGNRTVKRFNNGLETLTYKNPKPDIIKNN